MVLKGSRISSVIAPKSFSNGYKKLRERLINEKIINESFEFVENYVFSSPSAAAAVIAGYNINGPASWKNKQGKCINEIQ